MNRKFLARLVAVLALVIGFFISPGKSQAFDSFYNFSRSVMVIALALVATYLWRFGDRK